MQETQETRVQSLGWEDPLKEDMATHPSILAWKKSCGQRSLAGYGPWGVTKESDMTEQLSLCSLWDLSSRTRDRTQAPCSESLES